MKCSNVYSLRRDVHQTVLVKNGKTEHNIIGFEEFGGNFNFLIFSYFSFTAVDDFSTADVESVLKNWKIINQEPFTIYQESEKKYNEFYDHMRII